jgi:protein-tyrosine phosphatase
MTIALSKLNFRDLGGLPTDNGRATRRGVIYRSEGPASFFDEHRAELGVLGVRSVCDLRSRVERQVAPNDWCGPGCRVLHLDMNTDLRASGGQAWESLRTDPSPENAKRAMTMNYALMPAALSPQLPQIAATLLAGEVPMIIHCTAGKDRTGVAVAVLLALLGVSREQIVTDYTRSDVFGANIRIANSMDHAFRKTLGFVPSEAVKAVLMGVNSDFLLAALQAMDRDWGSVGAYFEASGVEPARQEQLRAALLE